MPKENKPKKGRPTKYKVEFNHQVIHLCKLGATNDEIADALKVSLATVKSWMKSNDEFLASVKEGKKLADERVEKALHCRATGLELKETTIEIAANGDKKERTTIKQIAPDTTACLAWLHNRDRDNWKPRKAEEDSVSNDAEPIQPTFSIAPAKGDVKVTNGAE